MSSIERPTSSPELAGEWNSAILATDGSVRHHGQPDTPSETALGYRLETRDGDLIVEDNIYLPNSQIHNCEAEALAVLAGVYAAQDNDITALYLHTDSKVVADHLNNTHTATSNQLVTALNPITKLLDDFTYTHIKHVSREHELIKTAHALAHIAFPR